MERAQGRGVMSCCRRSTSSYFPLSSLLFFRKPQAARPTPTFKSAWRRKVDWGLAALPRYRKRPAQNRRSRRGNERAADRFAAIIPRDTFRFGRKHLESEGTADVP